jgi:diphthine-ammonia ligase
MGDTKKIYLDYLKAGFKAVVVRTRLDVLGLEWLGRTLDKKFYDNILKLGNVDPCGEGGEYHTFVYDGPNFKDHIEVLETEKSKLDGGFGYLEIKNFAVKPKGGKLSNEKQP